MKICFFDLDGTLLTKDKTVSYQTKMYLEKLHDSGILIGYITARTKRKLYDLIAELPCDFIASYDGAIIDIFDEKKATTIYNECISDEDAYEIIDYLNSLEFVDVFAYFEPYYILNDRASTADGCDSFEYNSVTRSRFSGCQRIRARAKENVAVFENLPKYDRVYVYFENDDVVFRSKAVNKGKAVKYLLEYYKLSKREAVCFGDSSSDIDMFTECMLSVAMGNASDDVKKTATYVTLSNDDNGIVVAFNDFLNMRCQDV